MAGQEHPQWRLRQHSNRSSSSTSSALPTANITSWLIALVLAFLALGCVAAAVPVTTWAAHIPANTTTGTPANITTTSTPASQTANTTSSTTPTMAPNTTLTTTAPTTATTNATSTTITTSTTRGNTTTSTGAPGNGTTIASTVSSTSTTAKPRGHKGARRLTGGEIFAIVFIVGVVLYLLVGMVVRRRRGYTGLRVIPNHSFWTRTSENVKGRVAHIQQWFRGEREEDEAVLPRNPYGGYGSATDVL